MTVVHNIRIYAILYLNIINSYALIVKFNRPTHLYFIRIHYTKRQLSIHFYWPGNLTRSDVDQQMSLYLFAEFIILYHVYFYKLL